MHIFWLIRLKSFRFKCGLNLQISSVSIDRIKVIFQIFIVINLKEEGWLHRLICSSVWLQTKLYFKRVKYTYCFCIQLVLPLSLTFKLIYLKIIVFNPNILFLQRHMQIIIFICKEYPLQLNKSNIIHSLLVIIIN